MWLFGCDFKQERKKLKNTFNFSIICFLFSTICGGIYAYQEINPKYYGAELSVIKSYAAIGEQSAISELNKYNLYMAIHSSIGYLFCIFLILFIVITIVLILIKIAEKK